MRKLESKFVRHLLLQSLDLFREKLNYPAAFSADHVIVMFVFEVVFVVGLVVAKANFSGEARFGQKFKGAVDGRVADGWILFLDQPVKILAG